MFVKTSTGELFTYAQLREVESFYTGFDEAGDEISVRPGWPVDENHAGLDDLIADHGFARVIDTPAPTVTETQVAVRSGAELIGGEWKLKWSVRDFSNDELATYQIRKAYIDLSASDAVFIRCGKAGVEFPEAWQNYTESLREIVRDGGAGNYPLRPAYPSGT